jgi:hypothetical protein
MSAEEHEGNELTEQERRAFDALPREASVPPGFEDRVVAAARAGALVEPTSRPGSPARRHLVRFGLAAGLFGSGLAAGLASRRGDRGSGAPEGGALYLLLLYPGADPVAGRPAGEAARVAEYGAWAGALRRAGKLVSAERLRKEGRWLGGGPHEESVAVPQGFFLVRARDDAEAEAIARDCPHLRHGGRVAVQAVDPA